MDADAAKGVALLRQASGEYAAMIAMMGDDDAVQALGILQAEMERAIGSRLYKLSAIVWLRRKVEGGWL
jgi:hypothetical protein